ncbi:PREDICTED: cytidine deaminase 1-like [Camelina sativa]|uniref:cytidine deaminase n=1 Tax=Camelina sativa TaxID=90675 RepID=A0ABM0UAF2_CAMSA|nr:PREDICTED: cytidine deaminase 1-like [Camelina sativa]
MAQPSKFVFTREEAKSPGDNPTNIPFLIPLVRGPFSTFKVVALGFGSSGRVFVGVNVEFPGLPLHHSIHATQFVVANLALNLEKKLNYLAVSPPEAPCGHCRQFLQEIREAPEMNIILSDQNGDNVSTVSLESLLPKRLSPDSQLPKDVPRLLEPRYNRLTLSGPDFDVPDRYPDLKPAGLVAANISYAPYSKCPSGVALVDRQGSVYRGWYMESVAYNPSLGPVQAALVDYMIRGGGGDRGFTEIVGAVLVEKKDAEVRQEQTARMLLETIAPNCDFKVFHCCENPKEN